MEHQLSQIRKTLHSNLNNKFLAQCAPVSSFRSLAHTRVMDANALPTELRADRLILRSVDMGIDADCAKVNCVRCNAVGGPTHEPQPEPEAIRQVRYKNRVHGPRQELCTRAPAPASIYWLLWLPTSAGRAPESEDLGNLVGIVAMSFRQEMPYPDQGYVTVAAHGATAMQPKAARKCCGTGATW